MLQDTRLLYDCLRKATPGVHVHKTSFRVLRARHNGRRQRVQSRYPGARAKPRGASSGGLRTRRNSRGRAFAGRLSMTVVRVRLRPGTRAVGPRKDGNLGHDFSDANLGLVTLLE